MMEAPSDLRADGLVTPLGLERRAPRLSWRTPAGFEPVAVEIELDGTVNRVESVHPWADWPCAPLADRQRATWRVRLVNAAAAVTPWSAQTWCEAGIANANWKAGWVDAPGFGHPLLRCRFDVGDPAELARARLYVAGLGLCVVTLNGVRVGDRVIFPHHTDWTRRVEYQVEDVVSLLLPGSNVLGVRLGGGWFERFGYGRRRLRAQLELDGPSARHVVGGTPAEWEAVDGPLRCDDLCDGEWYDARRARPGWDAGEQAGTDWRTCGWWFKELPADAPGGRMVGLVGPPTRVRETLDPVAVDRRAPDRMVIDAGRNGTGWLRITLTGSAGDELRLRHGEQLNDAGELDITTNWGTDNEDRYTCAGNGQETWEPSFTYHGFRFAEVVGSATVLDGLRVEVRRIGDDCAPAATFFSSDRRLNELVSACARSIAGNLLGPLTDCPQRAERQGWLGDAHALMPTVLELFDAGPWLRRWLDDVAEIQNADTGVRFAPMAPVAPRMIAKPRCDHGRHRFAAEGWERRQEDTVYTAAATLMPWQHYRVVGNPAVLRDHLPQIHAHLAYLARREDWPLPRTTRHGDHAETGHLLGLPRTPKDYVGACMLAEELRTAAAIAAVLGQEARWFAVRRAEVIDAVRTEFGATAATLPQTQSALALALAGDLLPDSERPALANALVTAVAKADGKLTAGIITMPVLLDTLGHIGRRDLAYAGIMTEGEPGWRWMLDDGGGTLHENTVSKWPHVSRHHPALGVIAGFALRWVAGLRFDGAPGCAEAVIDPGFDLPLECCDLTRDTAHGRWRLAWGIGEMELRVPPGATATLSPSVRERFLAEQSSVLAAGNYRFPLVGAGNQCDRPGSTAESS